MKRLNFRALFVPALLICLGCAGTPPYIKTSTDIPSHPARAGALDSAEVLVRRGMPEEARALLASFDCFNNQTEFVRYKLILIKALERESGQPAAAAHYRSLASAFPDSARFRVGYWSDLLQQAERDSIRSDSIRFHIRAEGDAFSRKEDQVSLFLAYSAAAMLNDSSADVRGDRLCLNYPASAEANDLIGGRFWDGLYPIWTNDSAKVPYLKDFIAKYYASDWALYARRNLIASLFALKDTAAVIEQVFELVRLEQDDPLILSQAAAALYDVLGTSDSVTAWTERAYSLRDNLVRPSYYSPPEWALVEQSAKAGFPLALATLKIKQNNWTEARRLAEESLSLAVYDVDDNNTPAPQYLTLGRIWMALGDSTKAALYWTRAAMEGDVYNRFAGKAVDSLKAVFGLKDDAAVIQFCRKTVDYKGITFDRVTAEAGLDSARGGRVAWGDYDSDGDDDLLAGGSRLFANVNANANGGRFEDTTDRVGLKAEGCHGGIWGDYDSDGDFDIFGFSSSSDPARAERLLLNDGGRIFIPSSSSSLSDSFSTEAAVWFDANGDGLLDIYIPGYEKPAKGANDLGRAWPSRLLIQSADHTFHDSTEACGLVPQDGRWFCARSPVPCDFDRDGDQDLYVGDYRLQRNQLFVNGRWKMEDGTEGAEFHHPSSVFHDLAAYYGVDGEERDGWWGHTIGCEWGDFDGDGDFDLIVCNLAHPRYIGFSNRTMLYRNDVIVPPPIQTPDFGLQAPNSSLPFTDVRRAWGIKYEECHSEPVWGDFDNDGDLDLYITCVYPNRRSFLFENKGSRFEDITFLSGTRIFNGWGCATADYDNDGRLDLAVCEGGKVELFRNTVENAGNWLEITPDRRPGVHLTQIGGIVEVEAGGRKFIRQFEGGKGAGSQNSSTLHFGIGRATACNVTIFNYGRSERFGDLRANCKFEIGRETVGIGVH